MRIVGGKNKGRRLNAPKGKGTRPTSDRIREAIFNILNHGLGLKFEDCGVVDLFAGTGALALEALSRGAVHAVLIDNSSDAQSAIRENLSALGETQAKTFRRDARRLGAPPENMAPAGLAFLDPPYNQGLIEPALESLAQNNWLAPGAVVVAECAKGEELVFPNHYRLVEMRVYGTTKISFLSYQNETC
ncbi:MAG: 16S rRNA (guanine(966)-N(2))-methyltransferase RsmD [Rhodospirillales bacterium]|nr:16S rRNA (guanine(966)-N(2))-methyltransferase RsmD [Rhodospirillales bacterium]